MPKYKSLLLQEKVCLIEEASKSTASKTALAEKHHVPLSTLCNIRQEQAENTRRVQQDALGKAYTSTRSYIR